MMRSIRHARQAPLAFTTVSMPTSWAVLSAVVLGLMLLSALSCVHAPVQEGWKASPARVEAETKKNAEFIYAEAKVPPYTLPDSLTMNDGARVKKAKTWMTKRRPEILELFRREVYGRAPGRPAGMTFRVFDDDPAALGGAARRKQVTVNFTGREDGPSMDILIYLPARAKGPVPLFVLLEFNGNHAIGTDSAIRLTPNWVRGGGVPDANHQAQEKDRGLDAASYPVEKIIARGYGLATIYAGDIDPDFDDGFKNGVQGALDPPGERPPDAWGTIAAWAWGLSRAMDYFETDEDVDARRVAVLGHSRMGKTALWAGAQDERFAIVISNCSGCGGAALSRRQFGETVARINNSFPHWFCANFKKYGGREDTLPVDQHMLIALVAPRPVCVASADEDLWADPRGEFLSARAADPVYHLFGFKGLETDVMPPVNQPILTGRIGYFIRTGKHALTEYNWEQYMNFADRYFMKKGRKWGRKPQ